MSYRAFKRLLGETNRSTGGVQVGHVAGDGDGPISSDTTLVSATII